MNGSSLVEDGLRQKLQWTCLGRTEAEGNTLGQAGGSWQMPELTPEGNEADQGPQQWGWTCGLGRVESSEESGEGGARPLRAFKAKREPRLPWDGRGSLHFQKLPKAPPPLLQQ